MIEIPMQVAVTGETIPAAVAATGAAIPATIAVRLEVVPIPSNYGLITYNSGIITVS